MIKIIEWNCQGAFRHKNEKILSLKPDILIISECENEEKLSFGELTPTPTDFIWYGESTNKGIGIFSYSDFKFELLKEFNPNYRYVIPLKVTGRNNSFVLFAIWAMDNKENRNARYIGQIWSAINYYSDFLINENTILIGDFNSNKIWDSKDRNGNHSDVVEKLREKKILSLYHKKYKAEHGKEKHPTFFMHRKKQKSYHIDYCFASEKILKKDTNITIEKADDWLKHSDHIPLIIELEENINSNEIINSLEKGLKSNFDKMLLITQEKFKEFLTEILLLAKESDQKHDTLNNEKERMKIIEDAERILNIDNLIRQMNNKNRLTD